MPPMAPPIACNTEKKATPPNAVIRKLGFMKRFPIIIPATAVEAADAKIKLITLSIGFSKQSLYPMSLVKISKTALAAVKPKKWVALGLSPMVIIVAITPVTVTTPNFLTHHKASMSEIIPSISQKNGMWVVLQKIGAMYALSTLHRAAHIAIAAMSRLVK